MTVKRKCNWNGLETVSLVTDRTALNEIWGALEMGHDVSGTWHSDPVITIQIAAEESVDLVLIEEG